MAKQPDRAAIIIGVVGAAAVVGGVLYLAFSSKPASGAPAGSAAAASTDNAGATAAPSTTYHMTVSGDSNIALKSGESVAFSLPPVPAPASMWQIVVENHDGRAEQLPGTSDQVMAGRFSVIAEAPGVSMVRFNPINNQGGGVGVPGYNVSLSIS